ncbi:signal transduction histidine kinase [Actinocorallia herbida]|uniref:histidine kinase n=1 Tax=Actinocorallia herbida TaxID=58109 RepID=A0A3N1D2K6_9ACTN|nr:sensor histidine kinase [Actinocorallia herbida]ROO87308.1 signal transduction histidine kinase [Actinocorallia herbida]
MPTVKEGPRALFAEASRWWVRLLPWGVAFVLCVTLLPTTVNVLAADYGLNGGVASALAVAQTVPLLLAVVRPLQAWYVIFAADVAGALALLTVEAGAGLVWPFPPMEIIGYIGLCLALGLRERHRTLLAVWLATVSATVALEFAAPDGASRSGILLIILSGVALLLAGALREQYEVKRRLVAQEAISEAERERRTLLEERARIARELHDVVAHHMSVITIQADTAAYRHEGVPPGVRDELASIAATARRSLNEMRRLLGVLREEPRSELAPQPGLRQIGQLVEATARAGVPVEFGPCDTEVSEAVGLTAYRIVQEALANVVRHAPGAPTHVSVSEEGERLTIVVVNGPPPSPPAAPLEANATGHGLVGMRERVRLIGGTVDVGPLPDGGFRVAARLPLAERDLT